MKFKKIFLSILFAGIIVSNLPAMKNFCAKDDAGYEADDESTKHTATVNAITHEKLTSFLRKNHLDLEAFWDKNPLTLESQAELFDLPNGDKNKKFPAEFEAHMQKLQTKIRQTFDHLKQQIQNKSFNKGYSLEDFFADLGIQINQVNLLPKKHSIVSHLDPIKILEALEFMIIRHFCINSLNKRLNKGDKFIFDVPKIFIPIRMLTPESIEFSGYYDQRQDVYFPEDKQEAIPDEPSQPSFGKIIKVGLIIVVSIAPLFLQAILALIPQETPKTKIIYTKQGCEKSQKSDEASSFVPPPNECGFLRIYPETGPNQDDLNLYNDHDHFPRKIFEMQSPIKPADYDVCIKHCNGLMCSKIIHNGLIKLCVTQKKNATDGLCQHVDLSGYPEKPYLVRPDGSITQIRNPSQQDCQPFPYQCRPDDMKIIICINKTLKFIKNSTLGTIPLDETCKDIYDFIMSNIRGMFSSFYKKLPIFVIDTQSGYINAANHHNGHISYTKEYLEAIVKENALDVLIETTFHEIGHNDQIFNTQTECRIPNAGEKPACAKETPDIFQKGIIFNLELNADMMMVLANPKVLKQPGGRLLFIEKFGFKKGPFKIEHDRLTTYDQSGKESTDLVCNPKIELYKAIKETDELSNCYNSLYGFLEKYHPTIPCRTARLLNLYEAIQAANTKFDEYLKNKELEFK